MGRKAGQSNQTNFVIHRCILLSPNLNHGDTVVMDTVDMDTVVMVVTTEARGLLMPNLRLKHPLSLNPKLRLRLPHGEDTTEDTMAVLMDIMVDTTVITWARGQLRLMPNPDTDTTDMPVLTDTDIVVTTAEDTSMVELLKNLNRQDQVTRFLSIWLLLLFPPFFEQKIPSFFQCASRQRLLQLFL